MNFITYCHQYQRHELQFPKCSSVAVIIFVSLGIWSTELHNQHAHSTYNFDSGVLVAYDLYTINREKEKIYPPK